MKKKVFILDTNVILHDHHCIYSFEGHDLAIPITVLEEIDHFKKGHDQINYNAREFVRTLDSLSGDKLLSNGAPIGKGRGKITIITNHQLEERVKEVFSDNRPDHKILSVAYYLSHRFPAKQTILVSKDVNLRLKAKSLGLIAQDYLTDTMIDVQNLYSGKRVMTGIDPALIDQLYTEEGSLDPHELGITDISPNEYFILKNNKKSALAHYDPDAGLLFRTPVEKAYGIKPRNAEQTFAIHGLINPNNQLMTLSGKSGTGKTLLDLASALRVGSNYKQIYLARPIIPLSNQDMGYLPGGIEEKLDPYMQPLFDNLAVIKNQFRDNEKPSMKIDEMLKNGKLMIAPLAYIRGRSLARIFFIVDEAQNLTPHEVKTIITRAGEGTKIVFTGDPYQIDTPYLDTRSNGLTYLINRMQGQPLYGHITLEKGERSTLAELASDLL